MGAAASVFSGLDNSSCLQCLERAVLGDGSKAFGGDVDDNVLINLRHIDALLLEICLALYFPAWVKLRRTSAVAVAPTNLGLLSGYVALLCHTLV